MKNLFFIFILTSTFSFSQLDTEKYTSAVNAFNQADYSTAYKLFEELFTENNLTDELYATAKFYSGEALLNLGNVEGAISQYEFLVNKFSWSNFRDKALYKLGIIYYEQKQYSKARARLLRIIVEYNNSEHYGAALYWIGESYVEEGNLQEAVDFLSEAVSNRTNNKFIDYTIYSLAYVYERLGEYEKAVSYYDELLSYYKTSPLAASAQVRIGICYFKLKDYDYTILELSSPLITELSEDTQAEALYLLANSYYRVRQYSEAEKSYLDIIQKYPVNKIIRDVRYGLAWSYFQQDKFNDAYRVFNSLSTERDSLAEKSFFWKGEAKRYAGQDVEALTIYEEFINKFPQSSLVQAAQLQMGVIYFNNKRFDTSEKILLSSTSSNDEAVRVRSFTMLGEIELNKKQFAKAKTYFETALKINPVPEDLEYRALLGLGASNYYLGNFEQAMISLGDIDFRSPSFEISKVNFYLAEANFAKENYTEALKRFTKVHGDDEELNRLALYGRAYSLFNLKDYASSSTLFQEFIRKYPRDARVTDARLRLADSYFADKNFTAASRIYEELFKGGSSSALNDYTYYQYAQALYKSGKISEALNAFNELRLRFPKSQYAETSLYVIGWINFQQGRFNEAITQYKYMLAVYPNTSLKPLIYYSIGDGYFNIANYDSAIIYYRNMLSGNVAPNYIFDALNGLQYSYVALGTPERAIIMIDDYVLNNPNVSFADQLFFKKGEIYYSLRDYEKAKISYKDFISKFNRSPLIPEAYFWIGKSAQNLNQNEEAIFNFNFAFNNYPTSDIAASSAIELGTIHNNLKNYDAALNIYDKAISVLAKSNRLPEIIFMKGMTLLNKNDLNKAADIFDEVVTYYAGTIFAHKSKLELGLIDIKLKKYESAKNHLKQLADSRTDDLGAKAQYYHGLALFEEGNYKDAITSLVRIRHVFSNYDEWLTRSYLLLGDCYLKLNDKRQAREMYQAVLQKNRGDEFGKEAQRKLQGIK